jgi:fatty acyl-CoA reductase
MATSTLSAQSSPITNQTEDTNQLPSAAADSSNVAASQLTNQQEASAEAHKQKGSSSGNRGGMLSRSDVTHKSSSQAQPGSATGIQPDEFNKVSDLSVDATYNGVVYEEQATHTRQDVAGYYAGGDVFITGITGFLGKCILEKLLRSCPDIGNIFVLVRSKKGHCPSERVDALFDCKLYDKVQTMFNNKGCSVKSKVIPIAGDILEEGLGISAEDVERLSAANIETVIHSAATVRFDERLRLALQLNVGGTQKVIQLCRKLPKLKALVHVSTCYANCDLPYIKEQIYPPPADPHKLLDTLDWMTDEAANQLTPVLIGNKPNTYTYTKHLAEKLLEKEAGDWLPFIIVRPSIVGASWKEPFPGWIDNFNGPSGLMIACGMGLLRTMIGDPKAIADIVPVDIVANVIITAPWYRVNVVGDIRPIVNSDSSSPSTNNPPVFPEAIILTANSGTFNPFRWGKLHHALEYMRTEMPLKMAVRYPNAAWTGNKLMYFLWVFTCHRIPAFLMDCYMRCVGKKPRMMSLYRKLHRSVDTLSFFTARHWEWEVRSLIHLQQAMTPHDTNEFNTNIANMNWDEYLENFCVGTKCFVLNEELSDLHLAKKRMSRLKTIHYLFNILSAAVVWRLIMFKSEVASKLWSTFLRFFFRWLETMRLSRFVTL